MAVDLVCKMEVDEKTAKFTSEYKGETYYFCSPSCKKTFDQNPENFIDKVQSQEDDLKTH